MSLRKIPLNMAQPIFVNINTHLNFTVENCSPKFWTTSLIIKKLPNVNISPKSRQKIGTTSIHLMTFHLTIFHLKPKNNVSPYNISPKLNLTRVTDQAFGASPNACGRLSGPLGEMLLGEPSLGETSLGETLLGEPVLYRKIAQSDHLAIR
jgi:hypothetical protein